MKTEDQIREVFHNLVEKILYGNMKLLCIRHVELLFTNNPTHYAKSINNTIHFAMEAYTEDVKHNSTLEYKMVIRAMKNIPYYCDPNNDWRILTKEPEIYILLHELSHIIVHNLYPHNYKIKSHGKEFCGVYLYLLELIEPQMTCPVSDHDITWREDLDEDTDGWVAGRLGR